MNKVTALITFFLTATAQYASADNNTQMDACDQFTGLKTVSDQRLVSLQQKAMNYSTQLCQQILSDPLKALEDTDYLMPDSQPFGPQIAATIGTIFPENIFAKSANFSQAWLNYQPQKIPRSADFQPLKAKKIESDSFPPSTIGVYSPFPLSTQRFETQKSNTRCIGFSNCFEALLELEKAVEPYQKHVN